MHNPNVSFDFLHAAKFERTKEERNYQKYNVVIPVAGLMLSISVASVMREGQSRQM